MYMKKLHEKKFLKATPFFIRLGPRARYNITFGSLCGKRRNSATKTLQSCVKNFPFARQELITVVETGYKLATTSSCGYSILFSRKRTSGMPRKPVSDNIVVVFHNHTSTTVNTIIFKGILKREDKAA